MVLYLENYTDKTLEAVCYNTNTVLKPYSTTQIELHDLTEFTIYNKSDSNKTIFERIKSELLLDEIDLIHFNFGIKYCSFLRTDISINQKYKKASIKIEETEIENTTVLKLRCFKAKSGFASNKYSCIDKKHKAAFLISCFFALFVKYGIIATVGLIFCLGIMIDGSLFTESAQSIVFCFIALIVFLGFFVKYIYELIKILKISKTI